MKRYRKSRCLLRYEPIFKSEKRLRALFFDEKKRWSLREVGKQERRALAEAKRTRREFAERANEISARKVV